MRSFLTALRFLTILPVPGASDDGRLSRSMAFFPLAGLVVGAIAAGIFFGAMHVVPYEVAAFLAVTALALLTGGLHLDGVADVCDAFQPARSRERILEILKDSRVGAIGAVGIVIVFFGKVIFLGALPSSIGVPGFACVIALSRWAMTLSAAASAYARTEGTGKVFVGGAGRFEWFVSSILAIIIAVGMLRTIGLLLAAGMLLWTMALTTYFRRRIGGVTGDTLGFLGETSEWIGLLMMNILATNGYWSVWTPFSRWFGM